MSSVVIQVTTFPHQQTTVKPTGKGLLRSFGGTEIEDTSKEYLITEWEYTPGFQAPANNILGAKSASVLIENYNPDLLKAPITEVGFAKLRGEEHRAAWDGMIINMVKMFPPIPTAGTAAWTKTVEDNDLYVFLVGWDSVQAHQDAAASESAHRAMAGVHRLVEFEEKHVVLREL